ncbi:MAG: hypothetical protein LIO87_00280 [Eubacterium sp.]|nr:hypothetical protein [Eubacterium sp.]
MNTKVEKYIGKITLQNTVDITDPVYNKTVWCRLNGVPVISGDYNVYITKSNEGEFGQRISELKIISNQLPFTLTCQHCGEEFKTHNQYSKFCSDKCRKRHRIETAACEYCGKNLYKNGIEINSENYRAVFCSDECREKYKWKTVEENGLIGTCQHCGKRFIMHDSSAKFCSKDVLILRVTTQYFSII